MPNVAPARARHRCVAGLPLNGWIGVFALLLAVVAISARAQGLNGLLNTIAVAPEGEWRRVNANSFSDVWTPRPLAPLHYGADSPPQQRIIEVWSSFAWDSTRGDLWIFGGGHAAYPGNDTYRWRGATQRWERASLPSEIVNMNFPDRPEYFEVIDGADNAPISSHTYDNTLYLPRLDRYLTFGGAAYNTGGAFARKTGPTTARETGPYLFDPNKADANRVGGTTGSHVQREGLHPEIVGGNMWANRDLRGNLPTFSYHPINHVNGMTAQTVEAGKDVVYVGARRGFSTSLYLFRYVINDLANPAADTIALVGDSSHRISDQGAAGFDPVRKLFVRTGEAASPFLYWDLSGALGAGNVDRVIVPVVQGGSINFADLRNYGLDFDPVRDAFLLWKGGGQVWELLPPGRSGSASWLLRAIALPQQSPVPAPASTADGSGVLGKWKYASNIDAFVALQDAVAGNIWIYKPFGWRDPRVGGGNVPPAVALASPANGASFVAPASIPLAANATDSDGTITRVEFQAGTTVLGAATSAPFGFNWTNVPAGSYALTARATDDLGATTTSSVVNITVAAANAAPTVAITSPQTGAGFTAPGTINIVASAADADGTISKVDFFSGTTLLGTATSAPYSFSWTNVPAGSYSLSARATDNLGATATSSAVNITVAAANAAPTVAITSPQTGMSFNAPATINIVASAADADGTISKVDFFSGTLLLGTATSAPFNFSWTNVSAGSYTLSARATDNRGAVTASTPVNIVVAAPNTAPTVGMTSPANGSTFTAPAAIQLSANAADIDGTVAKVEFFAGSTLLATITSPPYNFAWTNVAAGIYAITARATDDRGAATVSASVSATVNPANAVPTVSLTNPANGASFVAPASINLAATASDSDGTIAKVEFLNGSTVIATVTAAPYTFAWTGVAAGNYTLRARATDNQNASALSAPANVAVGTVVPSPPSGLTASAVTRTGVTLTWTDASNNETEFRIQRSTNGRNFSRIATVGANVSTYVASGLTPNRTYYFRVRAANSAGASAYSNVVQITTLP